MLFNKRTNAVLWVSFFSGLPFALSSSTLQAWYASEHVSLMEIGALSLVGIPYTLKFLWAPVIDRFIPPWFGRRRGWISLTQGCMVLALIWMAFLSPTAQGSLLAMVALGLAFFSATQDMAINAYQTEILEPIERGFGAACTAFGYRTAMYISGGLAIILAGFEGWRTTYLAMAAFMLIGMIMTTVLPEKDNLHLKPRTFTEAVVEPLKDFLKRRHALYFLLFIALYKLSDAYGLALMTAFFIKLGFTLKQIGVANKSTAIIGALLGALAGGALMPRLGLFKSLLWFGVIQSIGILFFVVLNFHGNSLPWMVTAIFSESFTSSMGSVSFFAFLMGLCNQRYTATQYALFSAIASLGRVFLGPAAAGVVNHFGWVSFYFSSIALAVPSIIILYLLNRQGHFNEHDLLFLRKESVDAKKVRWQCRRGMLELDLLLTRFFDVHYEALSYEEKEIFQRLLANKDPLLWAWVSKTAECEEKAFSSVIDQLRQNFDASRT